MTFRRIFILFERRNRNRVGLTCGSMSNYTKECRILLLKSVDIFKTQVILKKKDVYELNYYDTIHNKKKSRARESS